MRILWLVILVCGLAAPVSAQSVRTIKGGQEAETVDQSAIVLPALPQAVAGTLASAVGLTAGLSVILVAGVASSSSGTD